MNTCKQLTINEYADLIAKNPNPKGYKTQEECEDRCGVCCSNICDSCSANLSFNIFRCNSNHNPPNTVDCGNLSPFEPGDVWKYERDLTLSDSDQPPQPVAGGILQTQIGFKDPPESTPGIDPDFIYNPASRAVVTYVGGVRPAGSFWVTENHSYKEILRSTPGGETAFYWSMKGKNRLYQCQDGLVVDITNTAVANDPQNNYVCYWEGEDENTTYYGKVNVGTVLDWSLTLDPGPVISPPGSPYPIYTRCPGAPQSFDEGQEPTSGFSTRGNIAVDDLFAEAQPEDLLSCTGPRQCLDTKTMTECEDGGGIWHPGLTCSQINCNA